MVRVEIVDAGAEKYGVVAPVRVLGRRWDNGAESVVVVKPRAESGRECVMIVTSGGGLVDLVKVGGEPIFVTSRWSQYASVEIGFSFRGEDGYVKNSDVVSFSFLRAQKPEEFLPVEAYMDATLVDVKDKGFTGVRWKAGASNVVEFVNIYGDAVGEVELSGFVSREQLEETNNVITALGENKADKSFVEQKVAELVNSAPETLDTLGEVAKALAENKNVVDALNDAVAEKADKSDLDEYALKTDLEQLVNAINTALENILGV